ncbi:MAG: pre-peptidase C-terminal domain-containing protein [Bdellovibrionales bacterium]|nr:pre-peptidase C-terminal domain-containing protein [Bdellovibrionales bacterium]
MFIFNGHVRALFSFFFVFTFLTPAFAQEALLQTPFGNLQADKKINQDANKTIEYSPQQGLILPAALPIESNKIVRLKQEASSASKIAHPSRAMARQLRNNSNLKNSRGWPLTNAQKVEQTKRQDLFYGESKSNFPGHLVSKPEVAKKKVVTRQRYPGRDKVETRLEYSRSQPSRFPTNKVKPLGHSVQVEKAVRAKSGRSQSSVLGDDNYEPNDYLSSAYDLSYDEGTWLSNVSGWGIQYDDDWYEIYVEPGYLEVTIQADFEHAYGDIDIALYNSNGTRLDSSTGTGDGEYINYEVSSSGYYYIKVYYSDVGNYYDLIWYTDYTGPVWEEDDYEPNDTRSSSYDLSYDEDTWLSSISGYGAQFDEDWYEIYVDYFYQRVILDLRFYDSEGDIDMALYNSSGNLVTSSQSSSDDEFIDYTVSDPGYYYVKIYYGNQGNPYDFKWYTLAGGNPFEEDNYEQNDSLGQSYNLSGYENVWLSQINGEGAQFDEDWYKIYLEPGYQRVIVDLRFEDDYGDIDLKLYNGSGSQLASSTSTSDDEYIDFTVSQPGYYYLKVYHANTGNPYDLLWYSLQGGIYEDNYEQNDSFGSAYDLRNHENTWLSNLHGYGTQTDDDYFKIQVDPDYQEVTLDLRFTHAYGDIDMILYNSSQQQVAASRSGSNDEFINVIVPDPGTYYVKIFYGNQGNTYDFIWYTDYSYVNQNTPVAPNQLTAEADGSETVLLDWQWDDPNYDPGHQGEDHYRFEVQRFENGSWTTIVHTESVDFLYFDDVTVQPGHNYKYRVRATNVNGNSAWSNEANVNVPDLVPQKPQNLSGVATSPNSVDLSWTWNDPVYVGQSGYGYNLARRRPNGSWSLVASSLNINARNFTDSTVSPDTRYEYRIRAYNPNGVSSWSNVTTVDVPREPTPVAAPENLLAFQSGDSEIHLTWNDRANNEQRFEVERRNLAGGDFSIVGTVAAVTSNTANRTAKFTDHSVAAGNSYEYRVRAIDLLASNYSNTSSTRVAFAGESCSNADAVACLVDDRYEVKVYWRDQHGTGRTGVGHRIAEKQTEQSAFFWFFGPDNVELVVKTLDASTSPNFNHNWVFHGSLSDVEYYVVVRETDTGRVKTYHNTKNNYCGNADTSAFSQVEGLNSSPSFQDLATALSPNITSRQEAPSVCAANDTTMCLNEGRFQVKVNWDTTGFNSNPQQGPGHVIPYSDLSGFFWFFGSNNVELIVKVLDGNDLNGKFWLFYGALSNVKYDLEVKDTQTGLVKVYHNSAGNICGVPDTSAF